MTRLCSIHNKAKTTERYGFLYCPICYKWLDTNICLCIYCTRNLKLKGKDAKTFLVVQKLKG